MSGGVTQRQEILNELSEKVEIVKQKTELKGNVYAFLKFSLNTLKTYVF